MRPDRWNDHHAVGAALFESLGQANAEPDRKNLGMVANRREPWAPL